MQFAMVSLPSGARIGSLHDAALKIRALSGLQLVT
jgi:hypothetical protein